MSQRGRGLSKHYWTTAQDDALVDSLYELSQNPMWRVDCGFQTGYLNQLESMLELKIPGCGLKASPHIESRVKYFKLKHNDVANMLALSGFGWDSEKSMIVCDKSVYDEYVKVKYLTLFFILRVREYIIIGFEVYNVLYLSGLFHLGCFGCSCSVFDSVSGLFMLKCCSCFFVPLLFLGFILLMC